MRGPHGEGEGVVISGTSGRLFKRKAKRGENEKGKKMVCWTKQGSGKQFWGAVKIGHGKAFKIGISGSIID